MPARRYTKKPVTIEAIQWAGDWASFQEIEKWAAPIRYDGGPLPKGVPGTYMIQVYDVLHQSWINVMPGDYIIRGIRGEYSPCNEKVFGETYREVDRWVKEETSNA